jgi:signal transduction histidine kinase
MSVKWQKNRRIKLLINPSFQLRMIGFFVGLALVMALVFYQTMSATMNVIKEQVNHLPLAQDQVVIEFLNGQKQFTMIVVGVSALFTIILLTIGGLLLSQKIAGPIERLREEMKRVREGQPVRNFLPRKGDFFQDFYSEFNDFAAHLGNKDRKQSN